MHAVPGGGCAVKGSIDARRAAPEKPPGEARKGHAVEIGPFFGSIELSGPVYVLVVLIGTVLTAFWLWMLSDALRNEPTPGEKLLWLLVIFFLHFIGALIYFFLRRGSRPWF